MKLGVAAVAVLAVAVTLFAALVVAMLGLDREMLLGVACGLTAGAGLSLLGGRGITRALSHTRRGALMVHMYGGFLLRLLLLATGFLALAASGAANPVGFAVAFLAGTVLVLFRQVLRLERVAT